MDFLRCTSRSVKLYHRQWMFTSTISSTKVPFHHPSSHAFSLHRFLPPSLSSCHNSHNKSDERERARSEHIHAINTLVFTRSLLLSCCRGSKHNREAKEKSAVSPLHPIFRSRETRNCERERNSIILSLSPSSRWLLVATSEEAGQKSQHAECKTMMA